MRQTIAIIGGGIAGLTARYLLSEKYEVTLFEKDGRLGGNAHTIHTSDGDDIDISVFAFSKVSYPNFFKLLGQLDIKTARFGMTGVTATTHNIDTHHTFRCRPFSLFGFTPSHLRTTWSMVANARRLIRMLDEGKLDGLSMTEAMKLVPALQGDAYKQLIFLLCLASSMYYSEVIGFDQLRTATRKAFWYIDKDELSEVVSTRPTAEEKR